MYTVASINLQLQDGMGSPWAASPDGFSRAPPANPYPGRPWSTMVPWSVSERNKRPKLTSKRRTDLKICVPEAKFVKESDFDVKSGVAPPKSTENDEKRISEPNNFVEQLFCVWKNRKLQIV